MNLFCFTLDGSTESVYEPAYSQTLKEVHSKYQCSPRLRRKPEWASSDPAINCNQLQSPIRLREINRRSCAPSTLLDVETLETREAPCPSRIHERTQTDQHCRGSAGASESPQSTTRLKKFVQSRKARQRGAAKVVKRKTHEVSDTNPVLTCIGLGRNSEIESSSSDLEEKHQLPENPCSSLDGAGWSPQLSDRLWSPFDRTRAQTPLSHTCHLPAHELRVLSGDLTLPRATEWERFQRMITELDRNQSDHPAPQMIRSITDLHCFQNTLTRFGRFEASRQHSSTTPPDHGGSLKRNVAASAQRLKSSEMEESSATERRPVEATPEKPLTAVTRDGEKREDESGRPLMKTHQLSCKSLESLYSLHSGQSSSSGVTSGCSSNRDSLRLEEESLYARQICGRARVHTDFVPSPYDTDSLKLRVGDVIDIISKPPMGIWTGVLNNKVGNFKFIYVDVLAESTPEGFQTSRLTHKCKSSVHEVLKRLSLESCHQDYSSCLQQNVDDLMRLREHHLTELDVTDPEHRQRLLAAVHSLQQLSSTCHSEDQQAACDVNSGPRDSGCLIPSDSAEDSKVQSQLCPPADTS
ncbi:SAM domain-containing protein SAMSN-1b isoform X1 [Synchiropus splendidus]|uniref:SAM domain-containing protein SAMSN-1b isoform X1 n=1 Tax=Synchiropus splendidus TaxID=270530 RepID=UPI00237E9191|nr:SAM domain-containing protein SAMSN-1b isoform X1 [Synchiropus splendidus]